MAMKMKDSSQIVTEEDEKFESRRFQKDEESLESVPLLVIPLARMKDQDDFVSVGDRARKGIDLSKTTAGFKMRKK